MRLLQFTRVRDHFVRLEIEYCVLFSFSKRTQGLRVEPLLSTLKQNFSCYVGVVCMYVNLNSFNCKLNNDDLYLFLDDFSHQILVEILEIVISSWN